jgi:cyanate permease
MRAASQSQGFCIAGVAPWPKGRLWSALKIYLTLWILLI